MSWPQMRGQIKWDEGGERWLLPLCRNANGRQIPTTFKWRISGLTLSILTGGSNVDTSTWFRCWIPLMLWISRIPIVHELPIRSQLSSFSSEHDIFHFHPHRIPRKDFIWFLLSGTPSLNYLFNFPRRYSNCSCHNVGVFPYHSSQLSD